MNLYISGADYPCSRTCPTGWWAGIAIQYCTVNASPSIPAHPDCALLQQARRGETPLTRSSFSGSLDEADLDELSRPSSILGSVDETQSLEAASAEVIQISLCSKPVCATVSLHMCKPGAQSMVMLKRCLRAIDSVGKVTAMLASQQVCIH